MHPETIVVILNWNGARLLPECLGALALQSYRDFRLVLVDNGSIDGSDRLLDDLERTAHPDWLPAPLPSGAQIIRNADNLGFAEGNNVALQDVGSKYVALLNNDAMAHPDWLAELVKTADVAPAEVGMVASTMLFSNRPDLVASAGIRIHKDGVALDRAMGVPFSEVKGWGARPVFGPSAGAALYTSRMLEDTDLFDARFFSYLEDADLAWRARSRGWHALHAPLSSVLHEYSATGGHNSPFKTTLISRNRVWLLYKNMPDVLLRRYLLPILRYDTLAVAGGLLSRNRYVLRGRLQGLRSLRTLRTDRLKNLTSARLHPDEMDRLLDKPLSIRGHQKYRQRLDSILRDR